MRGSDLLNVLSDTVLVGDGAMGTQLYARGVPLNANFDELNLTRPEIVRSVHTDYVRAGSRLLETNTYGANRGRLQAYGLADKLVDINAAGVRLAREAATERVFVAGSIGSLPSSEDSEEDDLHSLEELEDIFREQALLLADAGADIILLETFSDLEQLHCAVRAVKTHVDLPLIAQLTFQHRAVTSGGVNVHSALQGLEDLGADVVGTNCGRGVANVLHIVEDFTCQSRTPMSAFPNAGFPEDVGGRIMYLSSPQYLAEMIERMVEVGANIVGGCCGTTPQSIEAIVQRVGKRKPARRHIRTVPTAAVEQPPIMPPRRTTFLDRVRRRPVVFVELDPPFGLDFDKLLTGCRVLHNMGVDAVTMGDAPLATLRVSNLATAAMVQGEIGVECIPHMTCRDHNIIGMQSMLMGAWAQGIKSVLLITGDPAKLGNQPGSSSVYDLNSIGLIKIAAELNRGLNYAGASIKRASGFNIGCGFNPNFKNLQFEVKKLKRKVDAGAMFILTQLSFDVPRFIEAVRMIRDVGIDVPVFPAVFPFVSSRNAEFLHNELPGVRVPEGVLERMRLTSESTAQREGLAIARELIEGFWEHADGMYIVPPFNRYEVAAELVEHVYSHAGSLSRGSGISRSAMPTAEKDIPAGFTPDTPSGMDQGAGQHRTAAPRSTPAIRVLYAVVLALANALLMRYVAMHHGQLWYTATCAGGLMVAAIYVGLEVSRRGRDAHIVLNGLAVVTLCNFNIWAFSHLSNLLVFLGLYFFALFGLVFGAAVGRMMLAISAGQRSRAPLLTWLGIVLMWTGGLLLEAAYFPKDAQLGYLVKLKRVPPGETVEQAKLRIPREATAWLQDNYPPGGALGYLRWAADSGRVTFDVPGREDPVTYSLPQRPWWFIVRLVTSFGLLVFGAMAGGLVTKPIAVPVDDALAVQPG